MNQADKNQEIPSYLSDEPPEVFIGKSEDRRKRLSRAIIHSHTSISWGPRVSRETSDLRRRDIHPRQADGVGLPNRRLVSPCAAQGPQLLAPASRPLRFWWCSPPGAEKALGLTCPLR
ncbi:transmembrane protein 263 isoform X1 [Herpailurus yagouaroundi]|uniref:transmembrane protein 263 isoform X1 n=1 Tax=Herpailurus yagouaroundi TaxID=1608482 RepID=UPI001AD76ADB|nr:transmembrane protein 263 isoform X1 [Puma yagouaroundi]